MGIIRLDMNDAPYMRKIMGRMFNFDKISNNYNLIFNIVNLVFDDLKESNLIIFFQKQI